MSASPGQGAQDPFANTRMTLGQHLGELRKRLFRGALALAVCFLVGLYFNREVTGIVLRPHRQVVGRLNEHFLEKYEELTAEEPELRERYFEPDGTFRFHIDERLSALAPTEGMWFVLKVAGYAALFLGAPVMLWQMWQFVAAGLYKRERKWVFYFFPPALLLFFGGVLFSYFIMVPQGMFYLMQSTPLEAVRPELRLGDYFGFLATLCLSMGMVFQLPILMTFAGLTGLVQAGVFARGRGWFVIIAFVIAALLTPGPDIYSQLFMAAPMIVLYEVGIIGARLAGRRRSSAGES